MKHHPTALKKLVYEFNRSLVEGKFRENRPKLIGLPENIDV